MSIPQRGCVAVTDWETLTAWKTFTAREILTARKTVTQGTEQTGPSVTGRAAAESEPDFLDTLSKSVSHQLPGSERGGRQRVKLFFTKKPEAGSSGCLDYGCFTSVDQPVPGFYPPAERIVAINRPEYTAKSLGKDCREAFSAVGDRDDIHLISLRKSIKDRLSGLSGGKAALERIYGNENFHYVTESFPDTP